DVPHGSNLLPFITGAMGLCAVLDHFQSTILGHSHYRIHFTGPTGKMNSDNCSRPRRQHRFYRRHGEVLTVDIDVGKHRDSSSHSYTTGGCDEASASYYHL